MSKAILFFILIIIPFRLGVAAENYILRIGIQYERERKEVLNVRAKNGALLFINYENSIFQTPQKEVYLIQKGSMKLKEIIFGNVEAASYYNPSPDNIYRQGNFWKILPANIPAYENLKIRIPYTVHFSLQLNDSIIWTVQDKDRGGLLVIAIIGGGKGQKLFQ